MAQCTYYYNIAWKLKLHLRLDKHDTIVIGFELLTSWF